MKLQLIAIENASFALLHIPTRSELEHLNITVSMDWDFAYVEEQDTVLAQLSLSILSSDILLFRLGFNSQFSLEDILPEAKQGKFVLNKALAAHMIAVAYSTARGMICAKLEHTALRSFTLPLRNIAEQFPEDLEIERAKEFQSPSE